MRKILTLTLALVFCLGLAATSIDAKPRHGVSTNSSSWRNVHSWLGVYTQSVDRVLADAFDIDVDFGAIVNEVIEDSPADDAGLKNGDVIISFNGRKVWDKDDLIDYIDDSDPGNTAELVVMRKGEEVKINVEMGKRPRTTTVFNPPAPRAPSPQVFRYDDDRDKDLHFYSWQGNGYIGVNLSDLSGQLAQYFGVDRKKGVLITEVVENSPAEKAGLKAGDVITEIENKSVRGYSDVKEIVAESDKGDQLELTIVRNKNTQKVKVEVDERENSGYGYGIFSVPDVPDIDIRVPRGIGRFNHDDDDTYFDYEQYKDAMEKFREEMKKYKDDMRALSRDMSRLKKDDKSSERDRLEEQIEELRKQIKELEKKLE